MTRTMSSLSIFAYQSVKDKLTAREEWVLEAIEDMGEASAETVAQYYNVGVNVISGRFTGLKKKNRIVPTERKLTRTGNLAQFYRALDEVEHEFADTE